MAVALIFTVLMATHYSANAFIFWGGHSAPAVSNNGAVATDMVGVTYLGCYVDNWTRDLEGEYTRDNNGMTIDMCRNTCEAQGTEYFGVEYGVECFCGNSYGRYGTGNNCDYNCAGQNSQRCGGFWRLDVYRIDANNRDQWRQDMEDSREYLGCYTDSGNRDLPDNYLRDNNEMTLEMCQEQCMDAGRQYMGVEYGVECFCGNSYGSYGVGNNCNYDCAGDASQNCGGFWRLGVYRISGIVRDCPNNCILDECIDGDCPECAARFYLANGNCRSCPANCGICNDNGDCTDCDSGYTENNGNCEEDIEILPLEYLGHEAIDRGAVDRRARNVLILTDNSLSVQSDSGKVIGWSVTTKNSRPFLMSIWRSTGGDSYRYIGGTEFTAPGAGVHEITLLTNEQFRVQSGDVIAVSWSGGAVVRYKQGRSCGTTDQFRTLRGPERSYNPGNTITVEVQDRKCGEYRLEAIIDPNL